LVHAQVRHHPTQPIPYTLSFDGDVEGVLDRHYGGAHWRAHLQNAILEVPSPVPRVDDTRVPMCTDAYGSLWRTDCRPHRLVWPVLAEPAVEKLRLPPVESFFTPTWREAALRLIRANEDRFRVARFGYGLFERSWALRGFEQALIDSAASPAFYDELIEVIAAHQLQIVDRLLQLPVDGIMFSDDWGYQQGVLLGGSSWRRFLKPRYRRLYDRVHAAGKVVLSHCCGSIVDIMPDLIEIGLDVLESVQPEAMDPYALKRNFGAQIAFWGGLGSQSTIRFGTPGEIRAEVQRLCRQMGQGGGYILAPAKALQPDTPVANAAAVFESFLDQAGEAID
jgi:uroporphyrinogen decarboxylase